MDDEMETMCVFEAPENEALFQHARDPHEGLPASSLFVRAVLTVGNYDYTQTFKVKEDGEFEWYKELSGYAVGAYVLPGEESSKKMADLFGSMISESSYGALHTHSAVTKVDLDIAGTANSFKKKYAVPSHSHLVPATSTMMTPSPPLRISTTTPASQPTPHRSRGLRRYPALGNVQELLASTGIDTTGIVTQSPTTYYFKTEKITNEGVWDNDGDMTWTPPEACMRSETGYKYIQYSCAESSEITRPLPFASLDPPPRPPPTLGLSFMFCLQQR